MSSEKMKFLFLSQVMESSFSALVLYHLSKKFKACEAGRFQLLSCEIRYISMSLSQKIEAQRAVLNYERSQGGSGRPKEQNEGDLTCSAVICLSADTGSVERLWCHLPSESSQAGARPSAPLQELFQRQPSSSPGLAEQGNAGQGPQPKAAAAASSECPAQSPGAASQSGTGWAIHSANSLLPLQASPRDTGEWQSLL